MANVPSAEKRNRQRIKRRTRNITHMSTTRTLIKRATASLTGKDISSSPTMVAAAIKQLDKAAQKGVLNKKTASRKVSRLTRAMHKAAKPA